MQPDSQENCPSALSSFLEDLYKSVNSLLKLKQMAFINTNIRQSCFVQAHIV